MKRIACAFALIACTASPALAIPGQTDAQLQAWGRANTEFAQFARQSDTSPNGAGYEYVAKLNVDGHDCDFHVKPNSDGTIKYEVFVFHDLGPTLFPAANILLYRDTIARVYGEPYERDFSFAAHVPNTGNIAMWRGTLLGYSGYGNALLIFTPREFDAILKRSHCTASGCTTQS